MERCPTCQARLREEPVCPRCRTDLARPMAIEARAKAQLHLAVACLAAHDRVSAQSALQRSLACHRTPLARLLYAWLTEPSGSERKGPGNAVRAEVSGEAENCCEE